jgi:DNA-binding response OmpR family regulator
VSAARVVLVEDDDVIGANLARALATGFDIEWVSSGQEALDTVDDSTSLVLLDLGLPDIDGLDVCRRLTVAQPDLPIIVLTARREEIDAVLGLDAGAVDYVTKPFRLGELQARIRAQLRHRSLATTTESVVVGDLALDVDARRVWVDDEEVTLRAREFDLLAALVDHAGRVVRRDELMALVWDEHWFGSTKTLDVHMVSLRRKLQATNASHTVQITTLRGVG